MTKKYSENQSNFPNWRGRSGLDPVDTYQVGANADGIFLRRLFTLNLRTRNIFSLVTMFVFGIGATGLMLFAFYGLISTSPVNRLDLLDYLGLALLYSLFGIVLLIGLALLINFAINLGIMLGVIKTRKVSNKRVVEKKYPKRRKDYR